MDRCSCPLEVFHSIPALLSRRHSRELGFEPRTLRTQEQFLASRRSLLLTLSAFGSRCSLDRAISTFSCCLVIGSANRCSFSDTPGSASNRTQTSASQGRPSLQESPPPQPTDAKPGSRFSNFASRVVTRISHEDELPARVQCSLHSNFNALVCTQIRKFADPCQS